MIVQKINKRVIFEFKSLPIVMLEDKTIWHIERKKIINQKLNCRSLGYWIERRFYTKNKLNRLSFKSNKFILIDEIIDCPF
jgi:hypothetical protein